jgi:iron(III) transport system permease protein
MAPDGGTVTDERPAEEPAARETDAGGAYPVALTLVAGAVAAAVLAPLAWLVIASARVGPATAWTLLTRPTTVEVFVNSVLLVGVVTTASIALAVPLAYLTVRTNLPFRRFWTVAVSMPLVVPSYVGAFAFVSAFGPYGLASDLLGVEQIPSIYGLGGASLVLTLYTYPYVYITTRAALLSLDTTLVDAARTLRHTRLEAFRRVTVPRIRPAVAAGALLVALYTLSDFGTPAIMRFDAFTRVIYVEFNTFGRDLASLLSLQLVAVTVVILALESRVRGSDPVYADRQGNRADRVRLGKWRWPAMLLPALVSGVALVVPVAIFATWLLQGGSDVASALAFKPEGVSAAAAAGATAAGLPVAYLAARHRSRLAGVIERATYVGYAVPGVVMGLALVFFGASYLGAIYQTLPLLVFAYVVRFLPQAVGSTRASFLQVNPKLPEAARTLGRSSVGAFRSVTLPLVAPGLLGGAALVFLTTMKELPATLLLRPTGFETLVTHIWKVQKSGHFGHAAVPALVLVVVSAASMLVILSQEGYDVR